MPSPSSEPGEPTFDNKDYSIVDGYDRPGIFFVENSIPSANATTSYLHLQPTESQGALCEYGTATDNNRYPQIKSDYNYSYQNEGFIPGPEDGRCANDFSIPIESLNETFADFSDKSIRRGFIRKVYGILLIQLLVTFGIIALFVFNQRINLLATSNTSGMIVVGVLVIILSIITCCCDSIRRQSPVNLILLGTVTLTYALFAGFIAAYFSEESVLYAIGITLSISLGLLLFSLQTKLKFTVWTSIVLVILILGIILGIFFILVSQGIMSEHVNIKKRFPLACAFALIISMLIIYDLRRVVKGKHRFGVSPEEYVLATLGIYLDILLLFIIILIVMGIGGGGGSGSSSSSSSGGGGGGKWKCPGCLSWCDDIEENNERQEEDQGSSAV